MCPWTLPAQDPLTSGSPILSFFRALAPTCTPVSKSPQLSGQEVRIPGLRKSTWEFLYLLHLFAVFHEKRELRHPPLSPWLSVPPICSHFSVHFSNADGGKCWLFLGNCHHTLGAPGVLRTQTCSLLHPWDLGRSPHHVPELCSGGCLHYLYVCSESLNFLGQGRFFPRIPTVS